MLRKVRFRQSVRAHTALSAQIKIVLMVERNPLQKLTCYRKAAVKLKFIM